VNAAADTGARILVIDDEQQNLVLLRTMLRAAGYIHIEIVQRSADAVDRFDAFAPDLILLDLHMPPPDGFAVMEEVSKRIPPDDFLPILVLSADTNQNVRERALAEGASDLVRKPLQLAEVLLRIRNLLERRRRHRQLQARHEVAAAELARRHDAEQVEIELLDGIRDRIGEVLAAGGPMIVYQPIIDLGGTGRHRDPGTVVDLRAAPPAFDRGTMQPVGVEALARFNMKPTQGPDKWFNDAARVQLALDLELAAVAGALMGLDRLRDDLFISVNASWATIVAEPFHQLLDRFDGRRIVVELTEHERVADYALVDQSVQRLHRRGTRLAIDDAGAGFASLDHIVRLGPDIVKLDRNLVTGVDENPVRRSMIAAFVHFAAEVGISLIAEGIETVGELEALCRLGVDQGQGFHLARPGDLEAVAGLVQHRSLAD
jgi:EAL domain-containing protein (putative c-di-GMP-specific phosphodiesterase class I)/CheY-like chemotaxis protein